VPAAGDAVPASSRGSATVAPDPVGEVAPAGRREGQCGTRLRGHHVADDHIDLAGSRPLSADGRLVGQCDLAAAQLFDRQGCLAALSKRESVGRVGCSGLADGTGDGVAGGVARADGCESLSSGVVAVAGVEGEAGGEGKERWMTGG